MEGPILTSMLRAVGGSVMLAIPKSVLDALGLSANTKVALTIEKGRLVVEPRPKPKYTLHELLEQCDLSSPAGADEAAWQAMEPVGREIL